MSNFKVELVEITNPPYDHPNADRLSIIQIFDYICISAKVERNGVLEHRYSVGDKVVYVPEGTVVPTYILKEGFWSESEQKGILAGSKGDRVKAKMLRGTFSQGIILNAPNGILENENGDTKQFSVGECVAEFLGLTKYEAPIPDELMGEVATVVQAKSYDFESIQRYHDMFTTEDIVSVTEKLHGINMQMGFFDNLDVPDMFGRYGQVYVTSKGLAQKGIAFLNVEKNRNNPYVVMSNRLLKDGLEDRVKMLFGGSDVILFGEIVGVQDLKYGHSEHAYYAFDIMVDGEYLDPASFREAVKALEINAVPHLYEGKYDRGEIEKLRDGNTALPAKHIREGIVIKSVYRDRSVQYGRKIVKWVSPKYLTRKGGTEYS